MLAVVCALAGLLVGLFARPVLGRLRPREVTPPPITQPDEPEKPDEHDVLAGEIFDLAFAAEEPEVRRRALAMALRFGGSLIRPEEQDPFDDDAHLAEREIRTADPDRDGVTAGVIRPGLRNADGAVLRPAAVYRYVWPGRTPAGPAGLTASPGTATG